MKNRKVYWTALAVTGIGSVVLALILAFTARGTEFGSGYGGYFKDTSGRFYQERNYDENCGDTGCEETDARGYTGGCGNLGSRGYLGNRGYSGRSGHMSGFAHAGVAGHRGVTGHAGGFFIFLALVLVGIFVVRRSGKNGSTAVDPLSELAELYCRGSITRDEFLSRKTVLEEAEK